MDKLVRTITARTFTFTFTLTSHFTPKPTGLSFPRRPRRPQAKPRPFSAATSLPHPSAIIRTLKSVTLGNGRLLGGTLMSVTASARVRLSPVVAQLAANPTFVAAMAAWVAAQAAKVVLALFVDRKWEPRLMFASGGMPSSHSALCTALSTSVALCHGVADSLFPVCLGFTLIVMYDATGVRRHAGMQAEVLNMIVEDLFQGHPISQRKLKELLGHTPSQVIGGALLGIAVAFMCCQGCLVAT